MRKSRKIQVGPTNGFNESETVANIRIGNNTMYNRAMKNARNEYSFPL